MGKSGKSKRGRRSNGRAVASDEGLVRSGSFVRLGIGSQSFVARAADYLRGQGLEVKANCEDSKAPPDQVGHKRHFLWVRADQASNASDYLSGRAGDDGPKLPPSDGPPFSWGLCHEHPRWTLPCPDCFRF